ncbi:MAG TPA: ABC transporter substrate-binding protein [Terracidiphilus sp.]|nr:ABC transporter substrate-binding protein [Terracidiphilus sp.]
MCYRFAHIGVCTLALGIAMSLVAQSVQVCECGKHPPAPPRDRTEKPYAGEPRDLRPYAKFEAPYFENYLEPNIYTGAGRDIPDPTNITEVRIGFLGPVEPSPDATDGERMLHGAQLAIEEANARGGYGGKPFKLMVHNDYNNWQGSAVYGATRPTDSAIWGSAADEAVKMIYDEQDWAIFGSISSESTHIILRVALKAEIPIVNSASTDPTIPETYIPWYFTDLQDDRVQAYTLARHIYDEVGLKRIALLRVNNRYGRMGVPKFRNASVRLGHPVVIEQKFLPGDTDFSHELEIIRDSRVDGIVLWADEAEAASILKQMRAMGMKQRVFGSYRTLGPELLAQAGTAAEGFEAVFPYDPTRTNARWVEFNRRFETRFHEPPEQFASLANDAMNVLLDSICKAGLNRARIHDALANIEEYDGVTGHMVFDPNQKNVAPMYLGTVRDGTVTYRLATMERRAETQHRSDAGGTSSVSEEPYARVGEDGVGFAGPRSAGAAPGPVRVVLFGPNARAISSSLQQLTAMHDGAPGAQPWEIVPVDSAQNWGAATTQLVHALMDEHALAIIALDRDASHLAEQLALKCFVPVVALSSDRTLTSADIPWIFRLPLGSAPADGLRLLRAAVARAGADPEKMREVLASGAAIDGLSFLPTGEVRNR